MTMNQAIVEALRQAKRTGDGRYVLWSPEPEDRDGCHWQVADEQELDTFFLGCEPVAYVGPDDSPGTVEVGR